MENTAKVSETTLEIISLKQEIDRLQNHISTLTDTLDNGSDEFATLHDTETINQAFRIIDIYVDRMLVHSANCDVVNNEGK